MNTPYSRDISTLMNKKINKKIAITQNVIVIHVSSKHFNIRVKFSSWNLLSFKRIGRVFISALIHKVFPSSLLDTNKVQTLAFNS